MKIAVRYQSRGGNTKAVAEVIANRLGVKAEAADQGLSEHVDVLFVGGGVYMWKMDESLHQFLSDLEPDMVGQIVCFSTSGSMSSAINQMKAIAGQKGIAANEKELLLKMLLQGHSSLGLTGGKLSEKQVKKIEQFTDEVLSSLKRQS